MSRLTKTRNVPCFRSVHLNRIVAINRLDRSSLIALADSYSFPTELIDKLSDFLEAELIKIIVKNGKKKITISVPINSTDELKQVIRQYPKETYLYLTDAFVSEYLDRVLTVKMTKPQLDFYARVIKHNVPTN
jgi:hypothetical protein